MWFFFGDYTIQWGLIVSETFHISHEGGLECEVARFLIFVRDRLTVEEFRMFPLKFTV